MLAIACAAIFMARVGAPNVISSGKAYAEKTAVSTLRTLHWAQGLFRQGKYVDVDRNGVSEFGELGQLAGRDPLPSGDRITNSLLPEAGARVGENVLEAGGYCFRYDLPEGAHARERRFVAYGWPRRLEAGQKIFCIDQDEQIWESANPEGFAGCEGGPPRGICPEGDAADGWVRWRNKTNKLSVGAK